jgi:RecB family exonuclease
MAGTLLLRGWLTDGFRDAEQSGRWRERAREMVERYVADLDPDDEPLGVERTVATRTGRIALSGRIDRLDARGPELVVVDYKTGRRALTADDARSSLALALYAIAASRVLRRPCHTVELHHLPTGQAAIWEHTDESLRRHLERAEQIAAEVAEADEAFRSGLPQERVDEVFPPRPGALCAWCDYVRHCPEGRQAVSSPKEPWAALGDDGG